MTENKRAPGPKRTGTAKRTRALESRTQRLADAIRRHRGKATERMALLEGWILDLMLYLDIEVQDLIARTREEEST